jgi:hypothetical protein
MKNLPNEKVTDFRCCLCLNVHAPQKTICPPGGPSRRPESPCRFVVSFLDDNGARVFVSNGIDTTGKAWFTVRQKDTRHGTCRIKTKFLPVRKTFDEAQHDLNCYASTKGWNVVR